MINERELFERLDKISEILNDNEIEFFDSDNQYYHTIYTTFVPEEIYFLNGAWMAWQAKSQAVPEGYRLVPAELYNFQANHLAEEEFKQNKSLFEMEHRGLSGIEIELRQAKWLVHKAESIKENYRRLVKWASESGAEG